jgi:hypothetical protein
MALRRSGTVDTSMLNEIANYHQGFAFLLFLGGRTNLFASGTLSRIETLHSEDRRYPHTPPLGISEQASH